MLFYKKLVKDLQHYGFELNQHDPCVANKIVKGKQMTISWHVDDLKVSHVNPNEIDHFLKWVRETYGSVAEVKSTRGKIHDYLGMKLDFSIDGRVTIDMNDYVTTMIENFLKDVLLKGKVASPWTDNLFKVDQKSKLLDKSKLEQFHTTTAQALFLCKRGRPDISLPVAFFTTRVKASMEED